MREKRPSIPRPKPKPTPTSQPVPAAEVDDAVLFPEVTHPGKRAFLTAYSRCGTRQGAVRMLGFSDNRIHYYWLDSDPDYAEAFKRAERMAGDAAEDRAYELALDGYQQGVWHQGVKVGSETRYLPTLLLALLNAGLPDKYKFRQSITHDISPALEALQRQWQQASLPPVPRRPDAEPEHTIDAEFEAAPEPSERGPMPNAPTVEEIFAAIDASNHIESLEDPDDFAPEDAEPSPPVTPLRTPGYAWQQWSQQQRQQPNRGDV